MKKLSKTERLALLKKSMQEINKSAKTDVIHFGKDEESVKQLSVGVPKIDELLGGGVAYGRVTTAWGSPGCGKTTLAYYLTASGQKQGKIVYYIALEGFDPKRAKKFGVDLNDLLIGHFPKAEQSLDSIIKFAREGLVDVIILDSIQGLSPKAEQEEKSKAYKSLEKESMGLLARKLSQFFRVAIDPIGRNKVALFLIGQTRTSIGFIAFDQLSGGNALKHYSKLILHLRRGKKVDSPVEKYKEYYMEDGKQKFKTKQNIIGFDCVVVLDKTQITGTKIEGTKIHIPFYSESGFTKVDKSKCTDCKSGIGEDGLCECQRKEIQYPPKVEDSKVNIKTQNTQSPDKPKGSLIKENKDKEEVPKKRKRGRPRKEK